MIEGSEYTAAEYDIDFEEEEGSLTSEQREEFDRRMRALEYNNKELKDAQEQYNY